MTNTPDLQPDDGSSGSAMPTWDDAIVGITDSRFLGYRFQSAAETNLVQTGARIMYDRIYSMLAEQQRRAEGGER